MITVIQQSTSERREEIVALFEACKPLLERGYSLHKAAWRVKGTQPTNTKCGWYRDLIDYAMSQGYDYHGRRWQRGDTDAETLEIFEKCKPYLDQGYGFHKSCRLALGYSEKSNFAGRKWYKKFRDYAIRQGYERLR